jgi:benzaldehyde dehydrogenase (NAD)
MGAPDAIALLLDTTWQGKIFDGGWTAAQGGSQPIIEPATGATLGQTGKANGADVAQGGGQRARRPARLGRQRLQGTRRHLPQRRHTAGAHHDELAEWIARETGGILPKAQLELREAAAHLYEAAAMLTQPQGQLLAAPHGQLSIARRVPHGVVGVISPFNFPLILSLRSIAPALAMGNAVVHKPDLQTPVTAASSSPASSRRPACRRACCMCCPAAPTPARRCAAIPISPCCLSPAPPR